MGWKLMGFHGGVPTAGPDRPRCCAAAKCGRAFSQRMDRDNVKRNPGGWLRDRILDRNLGFALYVTAGTAWLCGAVGMVGMAFVLGSRNLDQWFSLIAVLPGAVFLVLGFYKAKRGWRLANMRKGARAEETIGQGIEYALTRDGCAVAHHVEEVARVGDIDHLVATPRGLWVIETKHRRVPKSEFAETLRRIAHNVAGVREWAPGTRVIGCLVFARVRGKPPKPTYEHGKETIRAFASRRDLMRELRNEAREAAESLDLARRVWKLGKLAAADQRDRDG